MVGRVEGGGEERGGGNSRRLVGKLRIQGTWSEIKGPVRQVVVGGWFGGCGWVVGWLLVVRSWWLWVVITVVVVVVLDVVGFGGCGCGCCGNCSQFSWLLL